MDFLETGEFAQVKGDEESQRDHTCEAEQLTCYYTNKSRNSLHLPHSDYVSVKNNYESVYYGYNDRYDKKPKANFILLDQSGRNVSSVQMTVTCLHNG